VQETVGCAICRARSGAGGGRGAEVVDRRGGYCTGRIGLRGCPAPRCRPRADLLMAARSICKVVVIGLPGVHKTDFAGSSNVVIAIEARAVNKKGPGA
jgi:hypothetical protein